jgi:hypothetical protein
MHVVGPAPESAVPSMQVGPPVPPVTVTVTLASVAESELRVIEGLPLGSVKVWPTVSVSMAVVAGFMSRCSVQTLFALPVLTLSLA